MSITMQSNSKYSHFSACKFWLNFSTVRHGSDNGDGDDGISGDAVSTSTAADADEFHWYDNLPACEDYLR